MVNDRAVGIVDVVPSTVKIQINVNDEINVQLKLKTLLTEK